MQHNLTLPQTDAVRTLIVLLHNMEQIPGWHEQYGDNPYNQVHRALRSSIMYANGEEYADAFLRVMHESGYEFPTERAVQDRVPIPD